MPRTGTNDALLRRALSIEDLPWLLALFAATIVVLGKDFTSGALADADSAAHLMDGVLIHDWVMAGPPAWRDPMEFARKQYAHYPTLGIGRHYPPGFAMVEAGFFAVFGINEAAARLCVLFFGLLMVMGAYVFVRRAYTPAAAALTAAILLTFPATTLWGRQTMLEIPTMAALIWAGVGCQAYFREPTHGRLITGISLTVLAILFKQPAVFLVCAFALTLVIGALRGRTPWGHAVVTTVLGTLALGAVVLSFDDACFKTLAGYRTYSDPWGFGALSFYARATPYLTGRALLVLAIAGAALYLRRDREHGVLLLCWVGVAYLMVTAASLKVPRFFYVAVFPLAVWAAVGTERLLTLLPARRLRTAAAGSCILALCAVGYARPVRGSPDYAPVVAAHRNHIADRPVLFSGLRDGDFVFAVRQHLPWRSSVVIRGSKLLYTCTAGPALDLVSDVNTIAQLREVLNRFAFEFIFVERENIVGTAQDELLRQYLSTGDDYRLLASHALLPGPSQVFPQSIDVYELAKPMARTVEYFDIPMPRTGAPIRINLKRQLMSDGAL